MKLFDEVDPEKRRPGVPPLVFLVQPDSHIVFETNDELKAWENEIRARLGVKLSMTLSSGTECCCGGRTDDCDVQQ